MADIGFGRDRFPRSVVFIDFRQFQPPSRVLSPKQKVEAYQVDPVTLQSKHTVMNEALLNEAIAYYQTASRAYKRGDLKEARNPNELSIAKANNRHRFTFADVSVRQSP